VEFLLQKRKVEVLSGRGFLSDKNTVLVTLGNDHKELRTKNVILATGSRPQSIPGCEIDNKNILDSDGLLALDAPPKSLIVVGAGAVGCEWAQIMHALGCKVTVVEMLETLLPAEDTEAGKLLARVFRKWGIDTHTGTAIASVAQDSNGVTATLADGTTVSAEKLLLSVGRKPNFENLWDPDLNIQGTPKGVRATEHMRTTLHNVFAIGDLIGAPLLAHKASAEGRIAAENALGGRSVMGYMIIPACTFTFPEVASVGLSEARAREQGIEVRVGSFQFRANGKALAMGETEGFIKLIASAETDVLLGGTVVGPHASDLIMEIAMGLKFGGDFPLMEQTVHPHPTLCEALHEALGDLTGSAIHRIKV
jgi:dihydrolipoamide dehydrogenase